MSNSNLYTTLRYQSLSAAIGDINLGSTQNAVSAASDAAVAVQLYPSGKRTVVLLQNLSEATPISVNESIDLVLDGNTLSLTTADAQLTFGAGTDCSIDGTVSGSSILKNCDSTADTNLLVSNARELLIRGGSYLLEGAIGSRATGVRANTGKLELHSCTLGVNNTYTGNTGIARTLFCAAGTQALVQDSKVTAQALYKSYAVMAAGCMEIRKTAISGQVTTNQSSIDTSVTVTVGSTGTLKLSDCAVTSSGKTVYITGIHNEGDLEMLHCSMDTTCVQTPASGIVNAGIASITDSTLNTKNTNGMVFGIQNDSELTMENVTVTASSESGTVNGIKNTGSLTCQQLQLNGSGQDNIVHGIYNEDKLTLSDADITVNGENGIINGIWSNGIASVKNSTIESTNQAGEACGIRNLGTLTVEDLSTTVSSVDNNVYGIQSVMQANAENNTAHITGLTVNAASTNGVPYGIYNSAELHLERSKVSAESQNNKAYGIKSDAVLQMDQSQVFAESQSNDAFGINNSGTAYIRFSNVHANIFGILEDTLEENPGDTSGDTAEDTTQTRHVAYGIYNNGTMTISDSKVMGDAPGSHSTSTATSFGIINAGTLCCIHTDAAASHSGLSNTRYLFVEGGVFTGYSHGGCYFSHGSDGIAFVNNAMMRCGHYSGIHLGSIGTSTDYPLGGAYVGGGTEERHSDITVYLDNCVFDSASSAYGLTLRGTSGETGNTVNMSNCSMIKAGQLIRIDKYSSETNALVSPPHHVNVGIGTGITAETFEYPEFVTFTQESYHRTRAYFKALVEEKEAEA